MEAKTPKLKFCPEPNSPHPKSFPEDSWSSGMETGLGGPAVLEEEISIRGRSTAKGGSLMVNLKVKAHED
jgi:hypothetical protein